MDVLFDAELVDLGGAVNSLEMTVPRELNVVGIECEGLTDWSRPAQDRLLLRFDRETGSSRRRLKVSGWIPTVDDPLSVGAQPRRVPTPWLEIAGMESLPGTLVIVSDTRVEAIGAGGMTRVSSGSAGAAGTTEAPKALTYRVDDPARLGSLQWTSTPPRVKVLIESQLDDPSGFRRVGRRAATTWPVVRWVGSTSSSPRRGH